MMLAQACGEPDDVPEGYDKAMLMIPNDPLCGNRQFLKHQSLFPLQKPPYLRYFIVRTCKNMTEHMMTMILSKTNCQWFYPDSQLVTSSPQD